jgi:hypothetical protein
MDGSGLSLIVVPVVAVICLAAWLIMVFYADSHPLWGRATDRRSSGRAAPADRRLDEARAADPAGTERDSTPAKMRARTRRRPEGPAHRGILSGRGTRLVASVTRHAEWARMGVRRHAGRGMTSGACGTAVAGVRVGTTEWEWPAVLSSWRSCAMELSRRVATPRAAAWPQRPRRTNGHGCPSRRRGRRYPRAHRGIAATDRRDARCRRPQPGPVKGTLRPRPR